MNRPLPKSPWSPWPIAIAGFFALAIGGAVAFVIFCNMHPEELVAPDYYEREVRYQGQMEKMARAQELPNRLSLTYDGLRQELRVIFPTEAFSSTTTGSIDLYRPSASRFDKAIALDPAQGTTQVIDTKNLAPGLWRVRVIWSHGGHEYWAEEKITLEAGNPATATQASVSSQILAANHPR